MVGILLAALAGYGVFLIYTAAAFEWHGFGATQRGDRRSTKVSARDWLNQAGLDDVPLNEFAAVVVVLAVVGAAIGFALFGTVIPALAAGLLCGTVPVNSYRRRRDHRRASAQESWPRIIEEIRILTASAGRSIPQALFEAGRSGPSDLTPAFEAAHREWVLSTDFARTVEVLKQRLADPTADAACETLLVAHEVGGTDLDRRLEALSEDRRQDTQGRKDARARQAGVKFARWFTIVVPVGMALVGLTIGDGRAAYRSASGQVVVLVALAMTVGCWLWAARIMRLPAERRVFDQ